MDRIEELLTQLCEEQDTMTHNLGHNAPVATAAQARRNALRRQIINEHREMVAAVEQLYEWVGENWVELQSAHHLPPEATFRQMQLAIGIGKDYLDIDVLIANRDAALAHAKGES